MHNRGMNKEEKAFSLIWDLLDDAPEHANDAFIESVLTSNGFTSSEASSLLSDFWAQY